MNLRLQPFFSRYATINAVALILTALPVSFQQVFYEHIVSVLDSEALHGMIFLNNFLLLEDLNKKYRF